MRVLALAAGVALRGSRAPRSVLCAARGGGENVHAEWSVEDDLVLWTARDEAEAAARLGRLAGGVSRRLRKLQDPKSAAARRLFGSAAGADVVDAAAAAAADDDYLALGDEALLKQCRVDYRRDSGPGGQKRNKAETAVRLTHGPTGVVANAADDRSQHVNRERALKRLRRAIAHGVRRTAPDVAAPAPALEPPLAGVLPWAPRAVERVGARHRDRPRAEQMLLDVLDAAEGSVGAAARHLGGSTAQLSKVLTKDPALLAAANAVRAAHALKPLRAR